MRLLRALLIFTLGVLAGVMAAARLVKKAMPSRGDEESNELALVAIFDGVELESRARAFEGGSMLAWFGGIEVDLQGAELAADARLSVHAIFGGIEITTPPSWRIESKAKALMGGIDVPAAAVDDPAAPVLTVSGTACFGGIEIGPRADAGT